MAIAYDAGQEEVADLDSLSAKFPKNKEDWAAQLAAARRLSYSYGYERGRKHGEQVVAADRTVLSRTLNEDAFCAISQMVNANARLTETLSQAINRLTSK